LNNHGGNWGKIHKRKVPELKRRGGTILFRKERRELWGVVREWGYLNSGGLFRWGRREYYHRYILKGGKTRAHSSPCGRHF